MIKARGGSGSWCETMTTGRNLAAKPRSAVQTSPGRGFIKEVQDFLFHRAGPDDVEEVPIGKFDDLDDLTPDPFSGFRTPFPELLVQPLS